MMVGVDITGLLQSINLISRSVENNTVLLKHALYGMHSYIYILQ